MAAQSVAPRSRRPQNTPDSDDAVIARALELSGWARENARLVIGVVVVLAVVIGGYFWYQARQAERLENAAAGFLQVEQTVASGNLALARSEIQQYVARFEGTAYATEARLLLARLQLDAGEPAEAIEVLQPAASDLNDPLGVEAAMLLAAAQQEAGDAEAAVATYRRVASEAEMSFRAEEALSSAALLLEQTGDYAGAAELYRELVATTEEGSQERSIYEMRLQEVESQAEFGAE